MDGRVRYIDIAKGISILLVAIFHSRLPVYFPETVWSMSLFRMPLFFLLSGVFFSFLVKPQKFIIEKSEVLLKPYFFVLLTVLAIDAAAGVDGVLYQFNGIFYGNGDTIKWAPLWFLTHLFAVYVFTYTLFNLFKFHLLSVTLQAFTLLIFISLGTFYVEFFWYKDILVFNHSLQLPGLPFSADILLITSVFFISGSLLRGALMKFKPNLLLVALSITLFYLICIYSDAHIDLNKRVYSSPFYATLGAFLGIYVVLSAAWYIAKVQWLSSLLLLFGEASLFILIFHVFIQENTYPYFVENVTDETTLMIMGLLSFLLSVLLPIGIKWLVLRSDILSLVFVRFKSNNLLQRTFYARR